MFGNLQLQSETSEGRQKVQYTDDAILDSNKLLPSVDSQTDTKFKLTPRLTQSSHFQRRADRNFANL